MKDLKLRLSPYHKIFYNEWLLDSSSNRNNIVFDQVISKELNILKLKLALKKFITDHFLFNSHIIEDIDNEPYWTKNNQIHELEYFINNYTYEQIYKYISRPFDLNTGPLYRFALFKEAPENYRFIIVLHHLVIDAASVDIFLSEIINYYNEKEHF